MAERPQLDPAVALNIVEAANDAIIVYDDTATVVWTNDAVDVLGWTPEQLLGHSALDFVAPHEIERVVTALDTLGSGFRLGSSAPFEVQAADGELVECDISPCVLGPAEAATGIAVNIRPTRDSRVLRQLLERLLRGDDATAVLTDMLDLLYHRNQWINVGVSFVDEEGNLAYVGDQIPPAMRGMDPSVPPWSRAHESGSEVVLEDLSELTPDVQGVATGAGFGGCWIIPVRVEDRPVALITYWTVSGGPKANLDTYSSELLRNLIELTWRWRKQARELERAATRDPLTGLPNRRALEQFDEVGPRRDVGVLYVDLDHFKPVNDRLGHAAGDLVLRTVANRLASVVRPTDIVARLGGDEFGVVCPGSSRAELEALAGEVRGLVGEVIGVRGEVVKVGASIGVAMGHDSVGPLLELADRALYDAKEAGRGTIRWADA